MMPKKAPLIETAPSVADITSSPTRVGQVDFGSSLVARRPEAEPDVDPADAGATPQPVVPSTTEGDRGPFLRAVDTLDDETRQAAQSTGEMLELLMELMTKDSGEQPASTAQVDVSPAASTGPVDSAGRSAADVAEVAASVSAAMRRVGEAHERHVVALELETARRCELLTSQAELDAELIRLHARREAHAIVFAARARSGRAGSDTEHDDHGDRLDDQLSDQLSDIGESLSHFAEMIESTGATDPLDTLDTTVAPPRPRLDIPRDS